MIYTGTERWLERSGLGIHDRRNIHSFGFALLLSDTLILFHGAAYFGDLCAHKSSRDLVILRYPGNTVVFLPCTVHSQREDAPASSTLHPRPATTER